jgi:acyl-CoA ligase (AMP-forming) (exosortase A-associated)
VRTQIHHLIEERASATTGASAVTYKEATLSYEELWHQVVAVAHGLRRLGLRRQDRVAIYLEKRPETVASIFGTSAAQGVFVPINPLLRPRQVGYIMSNCDARVLVTSAVRAAQLAEEIQACESLQAVIVVDGDPASSSPGPNGVSFASWSEFVASPAPVESSTGIDLDVAAILYTSGSTGNPKGVVLSHRNLIVGAESVSSYLQNHADDVILAALPLSFDAGFSQLTTGFSAGAHVVLMNYVLPADVVRLCARHGVTGLTCVPPLWIQIADREWPDDASASLRYFANTGGRMPKATLDKLRGRFPHARPYLMYGLTEAFRSTYLNPDEVERRPDSIGKAIPNAEILVVRPDGTLCDPGEEGELVHRGALVSLGYWNDPDRTAERFRPPPRAAVAVDTAEVAVWSGDTVVTDEEGFLYFVGRRDDMIKTSGYRVSPSEVEEVAYDTGLVRDAVAVGRPDPRLGETIALVVTAPEHSTLDVEQLIEAMKLELPLYMVPSEVIVREEISRSPNGKFDRRALRAELP